MKITTEEEYKRRGRRACENCAFWRNPINGSDGLILKVTSIYADGRQTIEYRHGFCTRRSPQSNKYPQWPITERYDWCGEFELSSEALKDLTEFYKLPAEEPK